MSDEFYPEYLMPVASQLEVRYRRFSELREQVLLDYGYNTARAYWSDLDSVCIWALERDKDPLELSETEIWQYVALLRRRKYSQNTIRRHVTALRKMYRQDPLRLDAENPADKVVIRSKRSTRITLHTEERASTASDGTTTHAGSYEELGKRRTSAGRNSRICTIAASDQVDRGSTSNDQPCESLLLHTTDKSLRSVDAHS